VEKDKWRRNKLATKGWHVMPFTTSHFRDNTISHYRSTQRCAAIFPVGGMKHSQEDPRRPLHPPDGGRDDLLGGVRWMLRLRSAQAKSKQNLSRLAGSGGSVLRIGIQWPQR